MAKLEWFSFDGVDRSLAHNAKQTIGRMRKDAPVDTGRLRREIKYTQSKHNITFTSKAIDPEDGRDYAPIQEYGSRYVKAQPYFNKNVRRFFVETGKDLTRRINNIIKKTR